MLNRNISRITTIRPLQCTLALSLGNRSACLFKMGDYELAIADINFALSLGYPEQTRYKLYDRLGKCHLKNGNPEKAKPSFLIASQLVCKNDDIEINKLEELKSSFQQSIQECAKEVSFVNVAKQVKANATLPNSPFVNNCQRDRSQQYQALGSKLEVIKADVVGRHVVAKENLELGEKVLVENPFAAVLYPEQIGKACTNCFR